MDEITLVRDTLRSHWKWHGGRLSLVSMLLMPYYGPELSTGVSGRLWKGKRTPTINVCNASFGKHG